MRPAGDETPRRRRGLVLVALVVALPATLVASAPALAAVASETAWRDVLERAVEATRSTPYDGETLLIELQGERPSMVKARVRNSPDGGLELGGALKVHLESSDNSGAALWGRRGRVGSILERLGDKYEVTVVGVDDLMDRPCTILEIRRRHDDALRERLWVDEESGLLVRRETFAEGDEPLRLATYLSLDLNPEPGPNAGDGELLAEASADPAAAAESTEVLAVHDAEPVNSRGLAALREAGWEVPPSLPGGYAPIGAYAVDAGTSQPLQLVYGDGLYVVSVFQQQGTPDWSSLPAGARRVQGLDQAVYEWPGTVPHRLLWEADGRTYSLVGDAPPPDLLELASALSQPEPPGVVERLRRGLGRLWSWATAFAR